MCGVDDAREQMAAFLRGKGIPAVTAWPDRGRQAVAVPVAAVSLRKVESVPAAFQGYLGEYYDPARGRWEERYGRRVKRAFGLDLYGSRGAEELQAAFGRLAEVLESGAAGGRLLELSAGETEYQRETGLYRRPVEAVYQACFYTAADETDAFLDFEIKGEMEK